MAAPGPRLSAPRAAPASRTEEWRAAPHSGGVSGGGVGGDECSHGTLRLCNEWVKHTGHLPTPERAPGAAKEAAAGPAPPFTQVAGDTEACRPSPLGSSRWVLCVEWSRRSGARPPAAS